MRPSSSTAATPPVAITSGFPSVTPGDSVGPGTTALNWPTSWGLNSTTVVPTWGPVSTTMAGNFSQSSSFSVFDSMGVQQTFPVTWTPAGDNTWTMTVGSPTDPSGNKSSGLLEDSSGISVSSYSYMVQFNADGSLGPITALPTNSVDSSGAATNATAPTTAAGLPELAAVWTDGATKSSGTTAIAVNLGSSGKTDGLSQFDTGQTTPLIAVKSTLQDGVQYGQLTGVSVDSNGNLIASYDNGQKVPIWKIPVVTFPNENGLQASNDGVYQQSSLSGNYTLNQAGTNGAGTITGSALESSNVNTAQEFSNMITAQQAYSSASQVVGADQKMFTTLIQQIQ